MKKRFHHLSLVLFPSKPSRGKKASFRKRTEFFVFYGPIYLGLILAFLLPGCSSGPGRNLASEACLVHKGLSTRTEVFQLLGRPDRISRGPTGTEDWYYYHINRSTLKKIPFLGKRLGEEEIEVLKVSFRGEKVVDCIYFVKKKK